MFRHEDIRWLLLPATIVSISVYGNDYLSQKQAQQVLFKDADEFSERQISLNDEQLSKIKSIAGVRQRSKSFSIWQAKKKGTPLGLFLIDEVVGKHEFITYAAALSPDGKVMGVEIMSYRETHGEAVRELSWRKNLIGKTLKDPMKLNEDVPNVSGATLSCRNVLDGVKRLLAIQAVVGNG